MFTREISKTNRLVELDLNTRRRVRRIKSVVGKWSVRGGGGHRLELSFSRLHVYKRDNGQREIPDHH